MKTLILTDMHSEDPFNLIDGEILKGIEKVVFLGDCDDPSFIKRFLELHVQKRFIIGNHDLYHSIGAIIESPDLELHPRGYRALWNLYPNEKNLILDNWCNKNHSDIGASVLEKIGRRKVVYTHGSMLPESPTDIIHDRLITGDLKQDNQKRKRLIQKMHNLGIGIHFRGHDHLSAVWRIEGNSYAREDINGPIHFRSNRRYIATIGSFRLTPRFSKRQYAVFDENKMDLHFYEPKS
jgi:predicted phosphodiesterase